MADQFDLEQGIMGCWNVTSDLDVLLEELMENQCFTQDQAANFVLGLSTIYEAKFDKCFRTFSEFLGEYYKTKNELKEARIELHDLHYQLEEIAAANEALCEQVQPVFLSLDDLFTQEENLSLVEDEFGFR